MELIIGCNGYGCKTEPVEVHVSEVGDFELGCEHEPIVLGDDSELGPGVVTIENALEWSDWFDELKIHHFGLDVVEAYLSSISEDIMEPIFGIFENIADTFIGVYRSEEDFAEEYVSQSYGGGDIPSIVWNNVDWSDVWNNELMYDFFYVDGYVFINA